MSAVMKMDFLTDSISDAEQRLREWGFQCGTPEILDSRRPYRDTTIKEMVEIGKAWKRRRDTQRERDEKRSEAARRAAETRRARREHDVKVCARCGHIHFRECARCNNDPRYSALGKQTRDFHPNLSGPIPRVTASAVQTDEIIGGLPAEMREVLRRCYCNHKTPWREHAWAMRMSWREFSRIREAAVEEVGERLAKRQFVAV